VCVVALLLLWRYKILAAILLGAALSNDGPAAVLVFGGIVVLAAWRTRRAGRLSFPKIPSGLDWHRRAES
jgi:hypothetical protein